MIRLYVSMLNIKKAKLSRQTPTCVLKGHAIAWPFSMAHASGAACIVQADKKTPHQFWQGVGSFVCFKAGLLSVTHQHQQEGEHVQEVKIQVQRSEDGGFGQPFLISVVRMCQILILDVLRVIGCEACEYQNANG